MGCNESTERRRNNADGTENGHIRECCTSSTEMATGLAVLAAVLLTSCVPCVAIKMAATGLAVLGAASCVARNYRIFRDDFGDDTAGYFRGLAVLGAVILASCVARKLGAVKMATGLAVLGAVILILASEDGNRGCNSGLLRSKEL